MKQLIFILFSFCVISNTYAATDCLQRPSCEELGYVQQKAQCACFGKEALPCPFNIKDSSTVFCGDFPPKKEACSPEFCAKAKSFFNGKENTKAIVDQLGKEALAAYAATQFYVGDKNGDFGQGTWYLPAIGEMMEMYGTDFSKVTGGKWGSGVTNLNAGYQVNKTLLKIYGGHSHDLFINSGVRTSSESNNSRMVFGLALPNGNRDNSSDKYAGTTLLIPFHLMKDFFKTLPDAPDKTPQFGDIVYTDKSYSSPNQFDKNKIPAGIIVHISEDCRDIKIVSLGHLHFNSDDSIDNFNPDNPFEGEFIQTCWTVQEKRMEDIIGVTNYSDAEFLEICHTIASCSCDFFNE